MAGRLELEVLGQLSVGKTGRVGALVCPLHSCLPGALLSCYLHNHPR